MIYNLSKQNSILNQFLTELRDLNIQQDRMRFKRNMERIGEAFAYEISKKLSYKEINVETPLGISTTNIPADELVVGTILRAGLPLHAGVLNVFDKAESVFISALRQHHKDGSFEIDIQYITCPEIQDKVLILTDPMLATGSSIEKSIHAILEHGQPKSIHLITVIASSFGLNYISRLFPEISIWTAAIDEELTAKSYIVPGLGDAGDLCYGSKEGNIHSNF